MTVRVGDRIRLVRMGDDPDPIPAGAEGTVDRVYESLYGDGMQVGIKWDNGRGLMLVVPPDEFVVIADPMKGTR